MATVKKIYEWLFYLIDNAVTTLVDNDKIAKVKTSKTQGIDDLAARIVQERTEYRKETIVNILTLANAAKIGKSSVALTTRATLLSWQE